MQTLHWIALLLGLGGVALVVIGMLKQRAAAPSDEIVGGFGGPPGSSDIGTDDGYTAPEPHAHFPVGRTERLLGLILILVALALVVYAWVS
ncbi:MAG: hypothetical protein GX344_01985 [Intrasporangiaceae bacterium]|nr:hypothetical protein [Intrasporangiaceae bacterium]